MMFAKTSGLVQHSCALALVAATHSFVFGVWASTPLKAQPEGAFLTRFDEVASLPEGWQISHFTVREPSIRTAWVRQAVVWENKDAPMALWLRPAPEDAEKEFLGAEIQRKRRTHYGHYQVEMTAAQGDGVISSFFTYTGPYFGDPQDEIDFEFLGRDTTKVWINRFVQGQKLPGLWIDLGFNAAAEPHIYAFDWLPDRLVWYVDGKELHRIEAPHHKIPTIPGRIYLNIWANSPRLAEWAGITAPNTNAVATYHCVSYHRPDETGPKCSDVRSGLRDHNDADTDS